MFFWPEKRVYVGPAAASVYVVDPQGVYAPRGNRKEKDEKSKYPF